MEANNRVNRVAEIITMVSGIGVIVLSSIVVIVGLILRRSLIYITYFLGDLISRTTMRIGNGYGYRLYSKLMLISSDLDNEDILWKTPNQEHPEIEQAHKHQRRR